MVIRPLLVATVGLVVVLAGFTGPAHAQPRDPGGLEHPAAPYLREDLRLDLSVEPALTDLSSISASTDPEPTDPEATPTVAAGRPEPEPWGDTDPWADAIQEASKLYARTPKTHLSPYPLVMNDQVRHFFDRFTGERRDVVGLWMSRAGRYLGMIRDVLRRNGLPEDLAFTAMIESGFNPLAVSRAGAKGLWQFMAATARRYGLRVDQWVDERLDPEKATTAAAAYLRDLHNMFGSWTLAQAAYNAGEMKVLRALRSTGVNDFWPLTRTQLLMRETKEFVPQIQAAVVIGRDPTRYGFEVREPEPETTERVAVPPSTDLRRLAAAAGLASDSLHSLNPVLVRGVTPPGAPYEVNVPVNRREAVMTALNPARRSTIAHASDATKRVAATGRIHIVRPRETVTSIARRYGLAIGDVLKMNSLEKHHAIRPGDRLRIAEGRSAPTR
jgi:membrane-bound lytic murein transglycosylase D